jgi:hypothetical protein
VVRPVQSCRLIRYSMPGQSAASRCPMGRVLPGWQNQQSGSKSGMAATHVECSKLRSC